MSSAIYYLKGQFAYLRTEPGPVFGLAGIKPSLSTIKADGGNMVKWKDKVILTNKIFKENDMSNEQLIPVLKELLEVKDFIVVTTEASDIVGHADGMVRFVNEKTVLINEYSSDKRAYKSFIPKFEQSIRDAGLKAIYLPYTSNNNDDVMDATGCYINYLQVAQNIFFPIFNQSEDEKAIEVIGSAFPGSNIVKIDCSELAKEGGVLNCISWNILK